MVDSASCSSQILLVSKGCIPAFRKALAKFSGKNALTVFGTEIYNIIAGDAYGLLCMHVMHSL